ncbi:MAG: iron-sulfur cluster assembly scaffold protein [Thermodesulfobacteriota bacterium]|jgi:nitrogen fixation NifU-like protein|nr:MAG: iron-sulfur cluster assembly scaffold protein [Thermodesulfobacteriota bacterium]
MSSDLEKTFDGGVDSSSGERGAIEYSEKFLDRCFNPRNWGMIENPQGIGKGSRMCGDGLEITLRITNDKIHDAKFFTEGCGPMLAAGSMVTELVVGKTVVDAFKISPQEINEALDGLPKESEHCADTAAETLKNALLNYLTFKKEPWKRAYNK